jgi:hypothetical protein
VLVREMLDFGRSSGEGGTSRRGAFRVDAMICYGGEQMLPLYISPTWTLSLGGRVCELLLRVQATARAIEEYVFADVVVFAPPYQFCQSRAPPPLSSRGAAQAWLPSPLNFRYSLRYLKSARPSTTTSTAANFDPSQHQPVTVVSTYALFLLTARRSDISLFPSLPNGGFHFQSQIQFSYNFDFLNFPPS